MGYFYLLNPSQLLYKIHPFLLIANGILAKREILAHSLKALTAERMLYHMSTYNKLWRSMGTSFHPKAYLFDADCIRTIIA